MRPRALPTDSLRPPTIPCWLMTPGRDAPGGTVGRADRLGDAWRVATRPRRDGHAWAPATGHPRHGPRRDRGRTDRLGTPRRPAPVHAGRAGTRRCSGGTEAPGPPPRATPNTGHTGEDLRHQRVVLQPERHALRPPVAQGMRHRRVAPPCGTDGPRRGSVRGNRAPHTGPLCHGARWGHATTDMPLEGRDTP